VTEQPIDAVLAEFRRMTEVSLTRIEGQLALLIQRQDQQDRRADAHDTRLAALDTRLDLVERTQVTRSDMEERSRRTVAWMGVVMAIVSVLTATGTTVIIAIVN
jgi:hypothetical protein